MMRERRNLRKWPIVSEVLCFLFLKSIHAPLAITHITLIGTQDLLIGVVGVGEHDPEKLNKSLLSRFGVSPDSFPTYKLFMGGNRGSKPVEPIPYLGEIKHGDILQFVTQHTKIRVSLPGCLKEFDSLVDKFMAGDSGQKLTIRREAMKVAETFVTSGRSEEDQQIGKYYVLIMKKVLERGDDFVAKEKARLSKVTPSYNHIRVILLFTFLYKI